MKWINQILCSSFTLMRTNLSMPSSLSLRWYGTVHGSIAGSKKSTRRNRSARRCSWYSAVLLALLFTSAPGGVGCATSSPLYLANDAYDDSFKSAVDQWWLNRPDWKWLKAQAYQESALKADARSSVGAEGLLQFMPETWNEELKLLRYPDLPPSDAAAAIELGAHYMLRLRNQWTAGRPLMEKHRLAEASYNAGLGSILKAQELCGGARLWDSVVPCLAAVTGPDNARQTKDYVDKIAHWRALMGD